MKMEIEMRFNEMYLVLYPQGEFTAVNELVITIEAICAEILTQTFFSFLSSYFLFPFVKKSLYTKNVDKILNFFWIISKLIF